MPRSRDLSTYPKEFAETLCQAFFEGSFTLTLSSWKAAKALQGTFYAYARAARLSPTASVEVLEAVNQVSIAVSGDPATPGPCQLVFTNKENGWMAVALRAALGTKSRSQELAESAEASVSKLMQALEQQPPATASPESTFAATVSYAEPIPSGDFEEKLSGYGLRSPRKT